MKLLTSTTKCFVTNSSSDVRLVIPVPNFKNDFYETVRKVFQIAFSPDLQTLNEEDRSTVLHLLSDSLQIGELVKTASNPIDEPNDVYEAFYEDGLLLTRLALTLGTNEIKLVSPDLGFSKAIKLEDAIKDFEEQGKPVKPFRLATLQPDKVYWFKACNEVEVLAPNAYYALTKVKIGSSKDLPYDEVACKAPLFVCQFSDEKPAKLVVIDNLIFNINGLVKNDNEITLYEPSAIEVVINSSHPKLQNFTKFVKVHSV